MKVGRTIHVSKLLRQWISMHACSENDVVSASFEIFHLMKTRYEEDLTVVGWGFESSQALLGRWGDAPVTKKSSFQGPKHSADKTPVDLLYGGPGQK
jgi:hypothetical protein